MTPGRPILALLMAHRWPLIGGLLGAFLVTDGLGEGSTPTPTPTPTGSFEGTRLVAVHLPGLIDQFEQGLGQERQDLVFFPIVPQRSNRRRRLTGSLRRLFFTIDRIRESGKLGHVFALRLLSGLALR